ncbi:50S ribosomal protein L9 [Patescibacteria group bacterium]|nr:50S ribosomal protein L9 [Patescibacteria group bacterium]MBU4274715.1 50S ribosomal protein L9 [Patescibacteria group bacterium]MBU4367858.1 50S ribosomal protein L9 [Patescibacteria group bacterium]MBU4461687.1 50S ribosomal protein L9 [Patescibacteria group bacterium]MCG2700308.1 50S ribosomal protein L9 [Candidatus Parcubacteria bacterium]
MKVILIQDIADLGKKNEIKEVKDGYARNFLIPKGLVKPATKENFKWLEGQKKIEEVKAEDELKKIQGFASNIDGLEVVITVKVGEDGQLFESINNQKIAEKLKELGFDIKKTQVLLENPIKELGEFPVKITLEHNLEAEITLIVNQEKEN